MLAGANVIYGPGLINSGMDFDIAQFVADNEIIRMLRSIQRGFVVDDKAIAVDAIREVGIGKDFLSHDTTLENMRLHPMPECSDRDERGTWESRGKKTFIENCREKAITMLEAPSNHYLSDSTRSEFEKIIEREEANIRK